MTGGVGPVPESGSELVLGLSKGHSFSEQAKEQESAVGSRPPHLNVALSKAALSGPSVCLRARAPCPLRVTCLRIARELRSRVPAGARQWTVPSSRSGAPVPHPPGPRGRAARAAGLRSSGWLLGTRQVNSPGAELTHGPATCAPCACLCKK